MDEPNGNAEVEVVVLSIHHGDRIILDTELVRLDTGCLLGHGEAGTRTIHGASAGHGVAGQQLLCSDGG